MAVVVLVHEVAEVFVVANGVRAGRDISLPDGQPHQVGEGLSPRGADSGPGARYCAARPPPGELTRPHFFGFLAPPTLPVARSTTANCRSPSRPRSESWWIRPGKAS